MSDERVWWRTPVFRLAVGPLAAFGAAMALAPAGTKGLVDAAFASIVAWAGFPWQVLVVSYTVVALGLAASPWGAARLGGADAPEMGTARWVSILLCTLLAGGGVFFSAGEPMFHFQAPPPHLGAIEASTREAVAPALAQSHLHWGTLAWCLVGTLGAIVLSAEQALRGRPLRPRTLVASLLGDAVDGPVGTCIDAVSIVAVVAGTVGPIGFLALQLSVSGELLLGVPDGMGPRLVVLGALVALYTASAASGIDRGIAWLSRLNVGLALVLGVVLLVLGTPWFTLGALGESLVFYGRHAPQMAMARGDAGWLGGWTIFYWGWFIGYAPLMAAFVARVSRGRTVRQLVLAVAVLAPLATHVWFTLVGGTGLGLELADPGVISSPLAEHGLAAALLAIVQASPYAGLWIPMFLVLVFCFLATTGDSMSYAIGVVISGRDDPPIAQRLFWAFAMGGLAALLLGVGGDGIDALQRFIVVTAVPVSLALLLTLVAGPLAARDLLRGVEREPSTIEP